MPGRRAHLSVTASERRILRAMAARSGGEADRAKVILRALDGASSKDIATGLVISAGHVRNVISAFRAGGVDALRARPHTGRPARLGPAAMKIAERVIARAGEGALTVAKLQREIARRGGPRISASHLYGLLKKTASPIVGRATRSRAGKTWMRADGRTAGFAA